VVDLFEFYTFNFGHIFIRAIVWKKILLTVNSLNFCKIYEQVLIVFLLPPPLCFSAAPPTAHRARFLRPPAAPSPPYPHHLASSSPARRLNDPAGSSSRGRVASPPARAATCVVDSQQLLPARSRASFSLGTCPVNVSFLLFPRANRIPVLFPARLLHRSSSIHRRQPSPPLHLSNFVLHQHSRISRSLSHPLFFLLLRMRSLERCTGDFILRRCSKF
jgi:hypothetical protein